MDNSVFCRCCLSVSSKVFSQGFTGHSPGWALSVHSPPSPPVTAPSRHCPPQDGAVDGSCPQIQRINIFFSFFRIWSAGLSFSCSFTHRAQNLHRLAGSGGSRSARYGSAQLHLSRVHRYSGGGSYSCESPVAREIHPRFPSAWISGKRHLPFSLERCFSEGHLAARRWKPWSC